MKTSIKRKIVIIGAGFSGAVVAHQIQRLENAEVIVIEKAPQGFIPETSTGLNLNPNGLAALDALDPKLCSELRGKGLPRGVMAASTIAGESLFSETIYDGTPSCLADTYGLRVRWSDAYQAIRKNITIHYQTELEDITFDGPQSSSIVCRDTKSRNCQTISDIDLVIAADGRYSKLRQIISPPAVSFIGVSNFRVLMPDTSGGLFNDMELIYCHPDYTKVPTKHGEDFNWSLHGLTRVGIMRMPFTRSGTPELYMYGNFAIQDEIPTYAKTPDGLIQLYTPESGKLSAKGEYLHTCFKEHSHRIHWARMQYINPLFCDATGRVLFLGDAAHATVPTLGQGATSAIEDACVAANILCDALASTDKDALCKATFQIDAICRPRAEYINSVSIEASRHLMVSGSQRDEALVHEREKWTSHDSLYRARYRRLMRGYSVSKIVSHEEVHRRYA